MLGSSITNWSNAKAFVSFPQSVWLWTFGDARIPDLVFLVSPERLTTTQFIVEWLDG
jgi:hypothetical protein